MAGRPRKKPEYNPELQFNNFLQELRAAYEEADSLGKCNIDKRAEAVVCSKKATKKEKASEYLRIMLSVEDVPSAEIIRRMDRIGIKERTIRTVQKEIGIEAYRKQGIWYWHMSEPEEEVDEE